MAAECWALGGAHPLPPPQWDHKGHLSTGAVPERGRGFKPGLPIWKGLPWALGTTRSAPLLSRCCRIRRYGPWRSWWRPSRSTRVRGPLWAGRPPFVPPGPATSGYQGSESIKLSPVVESGQWTPERSSDTQGGALLCGTESPERSPSPALSTGPASQSLEERQPRQEPRSVGWQPPESQGVPSQGQGERPRGASPGIPRVLVEQLLQMTLRPKLLSWPEVAWQPPCGGHRNPCPSFPEGTVTLQRQEELETTCAQLQQQVGEMEVREVPAQGCLPPGTGSEPTSLGSPHRTSHTGARGAPHPISGLG